jgi:hypothetical protein
MEVRVERNRFPKAKEVTWDDVVTKIDLEFKAGTHKAIYSHSYAPTLILHQKVFPGTIGEAYKEVEEQEGIIDMHVYTSFGAGAQSFGNHKDTMDSVLVQAIGRTGYVIENKDLYWLDPGDAIWIPRNVWHEPKIIGPRAILSFSYN